MIKIKMTTKDEYDAWAARRFFETIAGLRDGEELIIASPAKGTLVCWAEDGLARPIPSPGFCRKLADLIDPQAEGG